MQETLNYIKVLNWGYGGFAPMTLGQDFEKSLQQVQERMALLDGLEYGALLVEATSPNGKANLLKYQSTEDCIEYSLHFMRDRKELLRDHIPAMFIGFKNVVDKYRADGLWTDEQWKEYRVSLSQVERGFELRLKEFATAYDYSLSDDPNNPEPQQELTKPTRGKGRPKETLKDKMIDDTDGSKLQTIHAKISGKKGKDAALIILACIEKGWLTRPTYTQVKKEFGDIGSKAGYNRYLCKQMFTTEELDGAKNSLD